MTATLAPSPWPAPPAARPNGGEGGWRFGRRGSAADSWSWDLRRNCSISPRQLLSAYGLLCAIALTIALGFWSQGVPSVLLFAGIELLAVGAAMLVMARHAGDRELITLAGREMAVEQYVGPRVECTRLRADWVRVEPAAGAGSLVELSGEGRCVRIGRHVRPELRDELAEELRRALRLSQAGGERDWDQELQA
ncbi:DUF2244 domain-containing protein [Aquincola sp. S2]|uniref:DUF2244 domain-containing protein n=1 Tax=Pseudaquabacterium terrae TaxID=2732868 RepID=A0ABX2ECS0_9BURK|nr:DUF2244 domain-containing protein [Aquabacterium terrae]NRF66765.1 DUF2244 domain-containing protein [Aquabacterium terrae]